MSGTVGAAGPEPGRSGAATTTRPVPGPVRPYHFPRFERRALPNGVQLLVAPMHALPVVTVHVLLDAGAARDPVGREGVATLTAQLLAEGTTSLEGAALADRFERLGAALATGADWDSAWCESTVLTPRLDAVLTLLAEVVRSPAFAPREADRLVAQRLAALLEQRAEPRGLADDMFARFVYAPRARYGVPAGGSETSVRGLGRGDVVQFHQRHVVPASTTIVIAGDVSADAAARLVAERFGDWRPSGSFAESPAGNGAAPLDAESPDARGVHVIAKPDAPQSEVRVGHVAIPRAHPDWLPVHVMNAILGGLFSSRINLNLRERHAYTYGAFSTVDARRHAGTFDVSTAVESDVTAPAVREILTEIARMQEAPVGADELSLATAYLEGVFPIRYETTEAVAGALANVAIFGLPADYYDGYRGRVRALSADDVWRAARTHLRPEAARVVVVGDAARVREPLGGLGLGPVRVWDAAGAPLA